MNFKEHLKNLEAINQYRSPKKYNPISATHVIKDNKDFLMMASNNYLGLTHHPKVIEAAKEAVSLYGTGSGGARLTSGTFPLFELLEASLAKVKGEERALVFNTGYMANVGTISALMGKGSIIFSDEFNHASIIDGCRLSKATIVTYKHSDMESLEKALHMHKMVEHKLIVTDGVFSMDGDIAKLDTIVKLAKEYNAMVMVDDAHATGVIGEGLGTAHHFGVEKDVHIQLGTLSKALASVGGYVVAKEEIISYLINHSRSFIFSTALSPADIGAASAALEVMVEDESIIKSLRNNTNYMCELLRERGLEGTADTPIFPIIVKENAKALTAAKALDEKGIILTAIRPPTVPVNQSRLRLTVTAVHTKEELLYVADSIYEVLRNH